ncbi:Nif3-like dinuclear metal center hexameric protein [Phormidesmis sp. 146-35]
MTLEEMARFLNWFFGVHRYSEEVGGIYRSSSRPVHRVGLLLEPFPEISAWVSHQQLDAIFLHRPWKLADDFPVEVGVISYHLAFDERLTIGFNPRLAEALCLSDLEVLGKKEGRSIGMIGNAPIQEFTQCCQQVSEIFAGIKKTLPAQKTSVSRIAVVGAMTDPLIREASKRGAAVYITGQFRPTAESAVVETGLGIIEVGHQRCERWGLRSLAGVLQERWSELTVVMRGDF